MQSIPPLTKGSQFAIDVQANVPSPLPIVASSAWSGGLRTLCLVFGLTLGWIMIFDPSLVSGLSLHKLASLLSSL